VFLVKFVDAANGVSYEWSRTFGGVYNDVGNSVAVDPYGNPVVTGSLGNGESILVGQYNGNGDYA